MPVSKQEQVRRETVLAQMTKIEPEDVIRFWREAGWKRWFDSDPIFDAMIRERFGAPHDEAAAGRLSGWEDEAAAALRPLSPP
jgi:uncharacterized protein (DUF924 family)